MNENNMIKKSVKSNLSIFDHSTEIIYKTTFAIKVKITLQEVNKQLL